MTQISLDHEGESIKQFILSLPIRSEGVALELAGRVICKIVPAHDECNEAALLERGRQLVGKARERNCNASADEVEHAVEVAVEDVRRRGAK